MKPARIIALLLIAVLLSGCAQVGPAVTAEPVSAPATAPAAASRDRGYVLQPLAAQIVSDVRQPARVQKPADGLFGAKFEGENVAGSGQAVDGVYRFVATQTDGEAWHVKLESNYPTVAGRDYRVTYRFRSDVAGTVKLGDFQEFPIKAGENSVTGILIATGGTSYLDLQLGMLPPFTIDFSEIKVEEYADEVAYENALKAPVNFEKESRVYERHDQGYVPIPTREKDAVSLYYFSSSWEPGVWKSRLYVETDLIPEPGVRYRVTTDVTSDADFPFELLFNNGDEEKGYGALYGQTALAGEVTSCEAVIIGGSNGDELVLQFSLGEAPEDATVKIGNVRVEKILDHYTNQLPTGFAMDKIIATGKILRASIPVAYDSLPLTGFSYTGRDTVSEGHDDGYVVSMEESASSATLKITQAPKTDRGVWKAKLYAATGVTLQAGTTYRIKFNLLSARDQADYEVCFDGSAENAYGALYGRSLTAGGTDAVEYIVTPEESRGPLTLRLQLGKTDTTEGNTVTLSDLSVETLTPQVQSAGSVSLNGGSSGNVWEEHYDGVEQALAVSGSSAVLNVSAARSEGGVWSSKLFVRTGVTPEAGAKYRVGATLAATGDTGEFEILYQNADAEALYGGQWGLSGAGSYSADFTAPTTGCGELVLVFQLGNTAADNTLTVSDLQVRKLSAGTTADVELAGFAYPVTTAEGSSTPGSFELEANSGAAAVLSCDGSSATATVTTPGDDWHVKLYAKPGLELEAGQTYTVTMNVTGADGCTACYKNTATGAEDGFGTETITSGTVTHTVTPGENGTLEILLKLGNVPANTAVTVSNIQISKTTTDYIPVTLSGFAYPVTTDPVSTTVPASYVAQSVSTSASAVAWDESAATAAADGGTATLNVTQARNPGMGGMWSTRLEVDTGVTLEKDVQYKVSGTLTSEAAIDPFEVLYSNGSGTDEGAHNPGGQGYAEGSWGLKVESAGGSASFEKVFTVPERSEYRPLVLRIQLGNAPAPNTVTVSGIKVEKWVPEHEELSEASTAANSFELEANSGAAAVLSGDGASATAGVTTPGDDWRVKLYAKPNVALEAGKNYRISMNVTGADGCTACYKNTATGAEDGFGTEAIGTGTDTHTFTASDSGTLEILLKLGSVPADTAVTVSNIQIAEFTTGELEVTPAGFTYPVTTPAATTNNSFDLEANSGAAAVLTGDGSSATATVTTSGDDWHIKLYAKPGVELQAGKPYTITMNVTGADGCTACYKNTATGDEEGFGTETIGSGTVTHTVTPDANGTLEILLKLGTVPAGNSVTVSGVAIATLNDEMPGDNLITGALTAGTPANVNFWAHDDYAAALSLEGSAASLAIGTAPADGREAWKVKLFVETGLALEAGKHYRISADVSASAETDYEICYNDGAAEKGVGALYGLHAASASQTAVFEAAPASAANLVLQFNLGWAVSPCTVTVGNIKVEEVSYASGGSVLPSFSYDSVGNLSIAADAGYVTALEQSSSSATFHIFQAPAERNPWNVKLNVRTGFTPAAWKGYRVSFDIDAAADQGLFEVFYDGAAESAYGALYAQSLSAGKKTVSYIIMPGESRGELSVQIRLGKTDGTAGNTYTISNLRVEEVTFQYTQTPETKAVTSLSTQGGYITNLDKSRDRATLRIDRTPSEGREAWKNKLFVETGVTLRAGQKYRVCMNVRSIIPAPFEVCFNNGEEEKGVGAIDPVSETIYTF